MYSRRYDSLRNRLVLPFGLLGLLTCALLSGLAYGLVADLERRGIERVLQAEMESFRSRRAADAAALLPSAALIHGRALPSPELPGVTLPAEGGQPFQRHRVGASTYSVLIESIDGRPYAVLYDRTVSDASLYNLAWLLFGGTVLMTLVSTLVGHYLAGRVVRPIRRLLDEISQKSAQIGPRAAPVSFSATSYPANEIGQLALALDQFALRLHGFVERESHFVADVSHELRTPIAVIRGATEVLAEFAGFPEPLGERLRTIHRQAVRMGEILEAMLLLARENGQSGDPACAMAEVIEEAMSDCSGRHDGRNLEVAFEVHERPIVAVERPLAYVVVSNLLRNACSHTREGSVTIQLWGDRVEIIDTGIGIPEHRFPEIFNRYVKGEDSPGSGLGLSIVARITELLRWDIRIRSRSGEGTHVTLRFTPADSAPPA